MYKLYQVLAFIPLIEKLDFFSDLFTFFQPSHFGLN